MTGDPNAALEEWCTYCSTKDGHYTVGPIYDELRNEGYYVEEAAHIAFVLRPMFVAEIENVKAQRDALAQAIHEGRGILGFDNDGDDKPHTSNYIEYAVHWVRDAQSLRGDMDDLQREDEEQLATLAEVERLGRKYAQMGEKSVAHAIARSLGKQHAKKDD